MNWKKNICIINIIFLLLISFVGLRFLMIQATKTGGFQYLESHNGLYKATATTYYQKCFWGNPKQYYRFGIMNTTTGNIIHNIYMRPSGKTIFDMREEHNIITWSSDSSEATFAFQDIELSLMH